MRLSSDGLDLDHMVSHSPFAFDDRWLAEAVRLRERAMGRLEDAAAMAEARAAVMGAEPRILVRARVLGARAGLEPVLAAWSARVRLAAVVLLGLALIGGVGAGLAVAGDGQRPINVVWALGGLLGLNMLGLLVWLLGFLAPASTAPGVGAMWSWLSARMATGSAEVPRAFASLHRHAGLLRWWLGVATHAVWSAALSGALIGLAVSFLLRSHAFVWETTLLPSAFFVDFVAVAGWLPAQFGFAVPDPETVAASGATALADEAARRAWAWWLVGCVAVYGLLPRLLLWLGCALKLGRGRRRLRLDLHLPGYAELVTELTPASERIGITDAAPERIAVAHVDGEHGFDGPPSLAGIELRGDRPWPPVLPPGVRDLGVADSREQRSRLLAALAASPARRLLIACDGRLSPDRGSLALIADLSRHAGRCAVWLQGAGGERAGRWREVLADIGLETGALLEDERQALDWLAGRVDQGGDRNA
jgi:hypothetical protein